MKRPTVLYPTVRKGFIYGPIRYESIDGSEFFDEHPDDFLTQFSSYKPIQWNGKTYCVSHLQKKSKHFSLVFDPFIYHLGYFWKLQECVRDENGVMVWKPGTEQGIYFRTLGWRWQIPDEKSEGTPWIWSWGRFIGTHLD